VLRGRFLLQPNAATTLVRQIGRLHELGDGGRKLLRQFPPVDDLVVFVILEVELVTADSLHVVDQRTRETAICANAFVATRLGTSGEPRRQVR